MSALDPQEFVTDDTDGRGRLQVGQERAGKRLTYVVLDDDLDVVDGPQTKTVPTDGRLSLGGSEWANLEDVTVGIVNVREDDD